MLTLTLTYEPYYYLLSISKHMLSNSAPFVITKFSQRKRKRKEGRLADVKQTAIETKLQINLYTINTIELFTSTSEELIVLHVPPPTLRRSWARGSTECGPWCLRGTPPPRGCLGTATGSQWDPVPSPW